MKVELPMIRRLLVSLQLFSNKIPVRKMSINSKIGSAIAGFRFRLTAVYFFLQNLFCIFAVAGRVSYFRFPVIVNYRITATSGITVINLCRAVSHVLKSEKVVVWFRFYKVTVDVGSLVILPTP